MSATLLNLQALEQTETQHTPFPWLMVPRFIKDQALDAIETDFPQIDVPGSLPLQSLRYGVHFAQLMQEIQGPEMTALVAKKFAIDLSARPTMVTVRGKCRLTDGQIHTDSTTKLITVLIYMNGTWEQPGGRLRLLRTPDNLNDSFAEVPPEQGTMLIFKNQSNAWHGHEPFEGQRRAIQLNWVTDRGVVLREQIRHRISAFFKTLKGKQHGA